ncbi:hypothetical protein DFJ73DRAFT_763210 [Zopfochytrium polystomum]|nr:hypothetical protein DFJ73DRAFT_763210 [Zopfochytrium polystomum]
MTKQLVNSANPPPASFSESERFDFLMKSQIPAPFDCFLYTVVRLLNSMSVTGFKAAELTLERDVRIYYPEVQWSESFWRQNHTSNVTMWIPLAEVLDGEEFEKLDIAEVKGRMEYLSMRGALEARTLRELTKYNLSDILDDPLLARSVFQKPKYGNINIDLIELAHFHPYCDKKVTLRTVLIKDVIIDNSNPNLGRDSDRGRMNRSLADPGYSATYGIAFLNVAIPRPVYECLSAAAHAAAIRSANHRGFTESPDSPSLPDGSFTIESQPVHRFMMNVGLHPVERGYQSPLRLIEASKKRNIVATGTFTIRLKQVQDDGERIPLSSGDSFGRTRYELSFNLQELFVTGFTSVGAPAINPTGVINMDQQLLDMFVDEETTSSEPGRPSHHEPEFPLPKVRKDEGRESVILKARMPEISATRSKKATPSEYTWNTRHSLTAKELQEEIERLKRTIDETDAVKKTGIKEDRKLEIEKATQSRGMRDLCGQSPYASNILPPLSAAFAFNPVTSNGVTPSVQVLSQLLALTTSSSIYDYVCSLQNMHVFLSTGILSINVVPYVTDNVVLNSKMSSFTSEFLYDYRHVTIWTSPVEPLNYINTWHEYTEARLLRMGNVTGIRVLGDKVSHLNFRRALERFLDILPSYRQFKVVEDMYNNSRQGARRPTVRELNDEALKSSFITIIDHYARAHKNLRSRWTIFEAEMIHIKSCSDKMNAILEGLDPESSPEGIQVSSKKLASTIEAFNNISRRVEAEYNIDMGSISAIIRHAMSNRSPLSPINGKIAPLINPHIPEQHVPGEEDDEEGELKSQRSARVDDTTYRQRRLHRYWFLQPASQPDTVRSSAYPRTDSRKEDPKGKDLDLLDSGDESDGLPTWWYQVH